MTHQTDDCAPISIITSASYIADELSAEFGRLPASFLPIGHKRLYDVQAELLGPGAYLTLPACYQIPAADEEQLKAAQLTVIRVPDGLRLGNSVLYALEMIGDTSQTVRILHGDTIIYDLPAEPDVFAVGDAPSAYEWGIAADGVPAVVSGNESSAEVLAGYFSFSNGLTLRRSLARAQGDFLAAIHEYRREIDVEDRRVSHWLDFGHLQTYYRSRCSVRTQRAFNEIEISFKIVEKRSSNAAKLNAEAGWYEAIPPQLRMYTPAFLGRGRDADGSGSYAIEYLPVPSLHELFVFGNLGSASWRNIVRSCFDFIDACRVAEPSETPVIRRLTIGKTMDRLDTFLAGVDISRKQRWRYGERQLPTLHEIAEITAGLINMESRSFLGVMHGDLCFTNIFFDFRTQRIRVIDPRGTIDGKTASVLGDVRYDMAKLHHSIVGGYDFILAGRYSCRGFETRDLLLTFPSDSSFDLLNEVANEFQLGGLDFNSPEITAITIHLFLSMLPLHADRPDRQQAFIANALRIFTEKLEIA